MSHEKPCSTGNATVNGTTSARSTWSRNWVWRDRPSSLTKDQLKRIVDLTLERAEKDPTPKNLLALLRSIQAYESYGGIQPQIEGTTGDPKKPGDNTFSPQAIQAIKGLYGLKS